MKRILLFVRLNIQALLIISLLANAGLAALNFVVQPILRAGAVATAVATTQAQAELSERKAVAKTKAKARLRRLAAAVPILGAVAVGTFEYRDYQLWLEQNPDGDFDVYFDEITEVSLEVVDEVVGELQELPGASMVDREALLAALESLRFGTADETAQ